MGALVDSGFIRPKGFRVSYGPHTNAGAVEVIFGFFGYQCFRVPELAVDVILVELADTPDRPPGEALRPEEPTSGRHTSPPQKQAPWIDASVLFLGEPQAPGILTPKTL
jgi:hypothetical protein